MNSTQHYGMTEELKNYNVSIKVSPCEQSYISLNAQRLEIQPRIEQVQNNTLKITFYYNNNAILMIYLTFAKKNNNQQDAIKNNQINSGKIINSNILLHEDYTTKKNPISQYRDQIQYSSINHCFSFNKVTDSFKTDLTLETSLSITTFSYSFFFGQFDNIHSFQSTSSSAQEINIKTEEQQHQQFMISHAKNNENNNDQHIDDQQSTKSTSPLQQDLHNEYDNHNNAIVPQFGLQSQDCLMTRPTSLTATTTASAHMNDEQMKIEENNESCHLQYNKLRQRRSSKNNQQSSNNLNSHEESSCNDSARAKKAKYDKKNVVKNFIKAFDGYFLDSHNDQQLMSFFNIKSKEELKNMRQQYEEQEKKMKYNNKMIIAIIYSVFKDIFQHFLMYEADKWISHSSVFDKEAHRAILRDYIRAAENPRDIPKIVNLRIRNREPNSKN